MGNHPWVRIPPLPPSIVAMGFHMGKFVVAAVGALMLGISLAYLGWFAQRSAHNVSVLTSMLAAGPCEHPLIQAELSPNIMTETESRVLTLTLNPYGEPSMRNPYEKPIRLDHRCKANIAFLAPAFDHEPDGSARTIELGPEDVNETVDWVLSPKHRGQQTIVITGGLDKIVVPVTVLSDIGMTAAQSAWAAAFVAVGGFAGLLLALRESIARWVGPRS
jgi:hypothetical protein